MSGAVLRRIRRALVGRAWPQGWRSWAFDVLVALGWAALLVDDVIESPRPWLGGLVAGLATAALVVRRRWPAPVFGLALILVAASLTLHLGVGVDPQLLVALDTVVLGASRLSAAVASVLVLALESAQLTPWRGEEDFEAFLLFAAVTVAVTGLALYRSARAAALDELQQRADLLRQRAELLERERDRERRLAVSRERVRIAAEMHDVIGHHLTVMVTLAEGSLRVLPAGSQAGEAVGLIATTGREALTETRRILGVLRTSEPAHDEGTAQSAGATVRAAVHALDAAGVPVALDGIERWDDLPADLAAELARVVQEALTNVLKHAGPGTAAAVTMQLDDPGLLLTVDDDGAGEPRSQAVSSGSGLTGMRSRLAPWDADVRTGPRPDGGWRVQVQMQVPVRVPDRAAVTADR